MFKKIIGLSCLYLTLVSTQGFSQGQGNSPYAVFGLGEDGTQTNIAQDAMGGTGVSFSNGFYVNLLNPAVLVKNRTLGGYKYVAFNVGLKGRYNTISNVTTQQKDLGLNLNHLSMAFPLKPNWAMAVTLQPTSIVDHTTRQQRAIGGGASTESVFYDLDSRGGLSRISWSNSFKIGKSLFFGVEGIRNFGTIFRDTTSYLGLSSGTLLRNTNRTSLGGFSLKTGVTYQQKLNDKWQLNIGGTYEFSGKLKGELLRVFSTLTDAGNGPVLTRIPDTLALANVTATLPNSYRVGVSLESPFKWVFSAEYAVKQWSNYRGVDGKPSPFLQDSQEFNMGVEYLPNSSSTKYFNQVFYRVGFRQAQTPYVINGTRINDRSFSLGLSLPLGFRNPSYLDFSTAFGRRGVTTDGLIQENYIKFGVSASLLSSWFAKPRID